MIFSACWVLVVTVAAGPVDHERWDLFAVGCHASEEGCGIFRSLWVMSGGPRLRDEPRKDVEWMGDCMRYTEFRRKYPTAPYDPMR